MKQGHSMKHASTRAVFAHWNEQRRGRPAPERADIDPAAIRHALGDTLMLSADFVERLRFRLAGTRVCALFARELKGEEFGALWSEASRQPVEELLAVLGQESTGAVAGVTARTADGESADLELLLLPLAYSGHARIRALGVLVPASPPYWLGDKPVAELELGALRHIGADGDMSGTPVFAAPAPAATPENGSRVRHGFVVYSGGREAPTSEKTG
jgi:hypothetical protein